MDKLDYTDFVDSQTVYAWDRQPYDTDGSYRAFHDHYLLQTGRRSVNLAWRTYQADVLKKNADKITKTAREYFSYWSRGLNRNGEPLEGAATWAKRAQSLDDFMADIKRTVWMDRQAILREREWKASTDLADKSEKMLNFPVSRTVIQGGKTIIEPGPWRGGDVPRFLELASKLGRLATGMATSKEEVSIQGAGAGLGALASLEELGDIADAELSTVLQNLILAEAATIDGYQESDEPEDEQEDVP